MSRDDPGPGSGGFGLAGDGAARGSTTRRDGLVEPRFAREGAARFAARP